jgi:predicted nucleic acid-binding protein
MARTVYFDTSVFIELANRKSPIAKELKGLMKELTEERVRIYTSMITVQEMSVAELKDISDKQSVASKKETEDQKIERICENRRRRWDCFHIATAQSLGCAVLYSTDDKMQARQKQLGIRDLKISSPMATTPSIRGPLFPPA